MALALLLSSIDAGLIATLIMVTFLYLPLLWEGRTYDVLGAIGSALTKEAGARSLYVGGLLYLLGGLLVALAYGWLTLRVTQSPIFNLRRLVVFSAGPVEVNLVYPLIGFLVGLAHGVLVGLFTTILVEHHPLRQYRTRYLLVVSQVISHIVFGVTVMFFHAQFLQLLM